MKLFLALASLFAVASGKKALSSKALAMNDIKADSALGSKLLANARRVEENDEEVEFTWVAGYSLKFQGCHHIQQWNEEADGEEDVRIQTKRLVRFRLCPSNSCDNIDAGGCNEGYGEYIIDMNIYLEAYIQSVEAYNEWNCEYTEMMICDCEDDDNKGDDFDEEYCLWDCFSNLGLAETCEIENPNQNNQQEEEEFELQQFMECQNWQPDNGRRKLDQNEVEYFMGPYCAENGSEIRLGLFTDETCSTFADEYGGRETYSSLTYGKELPFGEDNLIQMSCYSCKEPEDVNENNDGNDAEDEDEVAEVCEEIYRQAGKCESSMGIDNPNENACNYMEGIKIVRQNGVISQGAGSKGSKTASVFIGIFVVAFVLLAAYVYYLKTKLDRASINLAE